MKKFIAIIDGPMGSGKTTVGDILRRSLKRTAVLGTDEIKLFLSDFERLDRDEVHEISAGVMRQMAKEYLQYDISVLLPQAFWKKEYIDPYLALAEENGIPIFVYQLEAPREMLVERIAGRLRKPVSQERVQMNLDTWEKHRYQLGKVFDTSKLTPAEIAQAILDDLS